MNDETRMGFWGRLPKPFFVLAPMADVTDAAFRRIIAARGKPDVMFTEFVSADGLVRAPEQGRLKLMHDLVFTEAERPIVAQFFTSTPEHMEKVARLSAELGFDGVDINMGCPDRSVEKQGAGAALMKNPSRARELIRAAKRGALAGFTETSKPGAPHATSVPLPVSVKTRIGYNTDELEIWLPELLAEEPAVITIHARTRKEMSKVAAHWDTIKRAVEIRNATGAKTLIVGNGDASSLTDARAKAVATGADGIMLGRAIFGNPWLFSEGKKSMSSENEDQSENKDQQEKSDPRIVLSTLLEHINLFDKLLGDIKSFAIMKKHFKAYITGWPGAAELRDELMNTKTAIEASTILENHIDIVDR